VYNFVKDPIKDTSHIRNDGGSHGKHLFKVHFPFLYSIALSFKWNQVNDGVIQWDININRYQQ